MSLKLEKIESDNDISYKVFWNNGVYLGEFVREVDGLYVFYIDIIQGRIGAWSAYSLSLLSKELEKLNTPNLKTT